MSSDSGGDSGAGISEAALVDGDCTEYLAPPIALGHGVMAYEKHDARYVWLCFDLPDGSYATGEFELETPALPVPLVLHVSGQLGEWPLGDDALRPTEPTSDLWWNNRGWTAIAARFNGTEETEEGPRLRFLTAGGQEFQFDRQRFGPGPWVFRGGFWSVSDGARGRVRVDVRDGEGDGLVLRFDRGR